MTTDSFATISSLDLTLVHGGQSTTEGSGKFSAKGYGVEGSVEGSGKSSTGKLSACYANANTACDMAATKQGVLWNTMDPAAAGACRVVEHNKCNTAFPKE